MTKAYTTMENKFDPMTEKEMQSRNERFRLLSPEKQRVEMDRLNIRADLENVTTFYQDAEAAESPELQEQLVLVTKIAELVKSYRGQALVVGGYARDKALEKFGYKLAPKDIDIEVFGVPFEKLFELLKQFGEPKLEGVQFAVIKLHGLDISIPRKDSKIGESHKDFTVTTDPSMTLQEAARRRDFTINALALDPLTGEIMDPWNGLSHMQKNILRIVDPELFKDDALRVLRAMQFAGRFGFTVGDSDDADDPTVEICRSMDLSHLPKERLREEWIKLFLKSPKPSIGLEAAMDLGIIEKLHPELLALRDTPQDPKWHPEGNVWTHTCMVADAAAELAAEKNLPKEEVLLLLAAALCHDLGKPKTTVTQEDGRITSHGHSEAGLAPARKFLEKIDIPEEYILKIERMVFDHLFPSVNRGVGTSAVRKLANRLSPATIQQLVNVGYADHKGRGGKWHGYPEGEELLRKASELSLSETKPKDIIMGRHLLALGIPAGVRHGRIIRELNQLHLDDKVNTLEHAQRLAPLLNLCLEAEQRNIPDEKLLNGEVLTKQEMIDFIKERFLDEGTHDMGTLVMAMILSGEQLPEVLEKNKTSILTAHKFGPVWFSYLDRPFYEQSWKSFYGQFEVDEEEQKKLKELTWQSQKDAGLRLVQVPRAESIEKYDTAFTIKPMEHQEKIALYNTAQYPFEAGMFDGYRLMVQYNPEKRRVSISVLDEDPIKVKEIDAKIRALLPEFTNAKKIGYLFASNTEGADDVFTLGDAKRIYEALKQSF